MAAKATIVLVAIALTIAGALPRAASQTVQQDVVSALLGEVRLLRAAIEQVAAAGAGGQLLLGRLQLQEQRVNASLDRLEQTRLELARSREVKEDADAAVAKFEEALSAGSKRRLVHSYGEVDQESIQLMAEHARKRVAECADEVRRLAAEESARTLELAAEQAVWAELNRRLEDVERRLTPTR